MHIVLTLQVDWALSLQIKDHELELDRGRRIGRIGFKLVNLALKASRSETSLWRETSYPWSLVFSMPRYAKSTCEGDGRRTWRTWRTIGLQGLLAYQEPFQTAAPWKCIHRKGIEKDTLCKSNSAKDHDAWLKIWRLPFAVLTTCRLSSRNKAVLPAGRDFRSLSNIRSFTLSKRTNGNKMQISFGN
jgi:hypothetical protein